MLRLSVLQHIERETPDLFVQIASEFNLEILITRLYLGDPLPALDQIDGLLVLGGPMGIEDINNPLYPWLNDEISFIKECQLKDLPTIGICLGAQLLAFSAGGEIEKLRLKENGEFQAEVGWSPLIFNQDLKNDPIHPYFCSPLYVLHWHSDRIILPSSSTLLASSSKCREQFFRIGTSSYGLQFHPEVNDISVQRWIEEDKLFINKALGPNASSILLKQQMEFSYKSRKHRSILIRGLFTLLWT